VGSILLVEADRDIAEQWALALREQGHEVVTTDAMRDVLPLIREGGIDCVILDTYTPRTGVVELARAIEQVPDAPPMVLVSGSPDAPEISARAGAAAFVALPCEPSELVTAVARLVGRVRPVLVVADDPSDSRPNTFE
jgi:DNA-binding NtrC family response regulator